MTQAVKPNPKSRVVSYLEGHLFKLVGDEDPYQEDLLFGADSFQVSGDAALTTTYVTGYSGTGRIQIGDPTDTIAVMAQRLQAIENQLDDLYNMILTTVSETKAEKDAFEDWARKVERKGERLDKNLESLEESLTDMSNAVDEVLARSKRPKKKAKGKGST